MVAHELPWKELLVPLHIFQRKGSPPQTSLRLAHLLQAQSVVLWRPVDGQLEGHSSMQVSDEKVFTDSFCSSSPPPKLRSWML